MDKNKNLYHNDCKCYILSRLSINFVLFLAVNSTISNSLMHTVIPNTYEEGIDELEKDIEHLERRLASAKSQLMFVTYQKDKQFKS